MRNLISYLFSPFNAFTYLLAIGAVGTLLFMLWVLVIAPWLIDKQIGK